MPTPNPNGENKKCRNDICDCHMCVELPECTVDNHDTCCEHCQPSTKDHKKDECICHQKVGPDIEPYFHCVNCIPTKIDGTQFAQEYNEAYIRSRTHHKKDEVEEARKLLEEWESDFYAGIKKYCKGYPSVENTLSKLTTDVKTLLSAQKAVTEAEVRGKHIKLVDKLLHGPDSLPKPKGEDEWVEGWKGACTDILNLLNNPHQT